MRKSFYRIILMLLITVPLLTACDDVIDTALEVLDFIDSEQEDVKKVTSDPVEGMRVHFIDVGQADAAFIQLNDTNILIDAGDWTGKEVVPYLQSLGVETIDLVVGSHEHADHIGQMDQVITHFEVGEVWLPGNMTNTQVLERLLTAIDQHNVDYYEPRAGEEFAIDELDIQILSPSEVTGNLNNDSIVMKITYGDISILFTGDAENKAEKIMLENGVDLQATILKVGHHGSNTSSSEKFIQQIKPEVGIISAGEDNKYNHPNQSTLDVLKKQKIDVYATSAHGTIIMNTDGKSYHIVPSRTGKVKAGD